MEWIAIITPIAIKLIERCREKRELNEVKASAKDRKVGRWAIRRELKKQGYSKKDRKEAMAALRAYEMDDDDVDEFVENAVD